MSTQNSLQLTTTDGSSFGPINVPGYGAGEYWYVDLMMHPQNFDTIYVGFGKKNDTIPDVFRSYNRGGDWTKLNCGLNASVRALVQSPVNPDLAIVASSKKMVRTANLHASSPDWKAMSDLPMLSGERYIQDVAFDPDNPARIFACVSGYSESNKIFMSVDTGNHWTNITGSLPNVPFHSLLVEDNAVNGIYAGSDIGVFYRNDNMSDWIHFSNHLPVTPVYDLDIDNSTLYAGTFGRGIWSSTLYTSCPTSQFFTQNDQPDGKQVYHTSGWITTSQVIEGNLGVDIQYHSEGFIKFISGFQAKAGNLVMAKIEGCPD